MQYFSNTQKWISLKKYCKQNAISIINFANGQKNKSPTCRMKLNKY